MKNDIKKLYKKDSKLAIQVAKALGYKIKVKAAKIISFSTLPEDIQSVLGSIGWTEMSTSEVQKGSSGYIIFMKGYGFISDISKKATTILSKNSKFKGIHLSKNKLGELGLIFKA